MNRGKVSVISRRVSLSRFLNKKVALLCSRKGGQCAFEEIYTAKPLEVWRKVLNLAAVKNKRFYGTGSMPETIN